MKRLRLNKETGKLGYDYTIDTAIVRWLKTETDPQTFGQIREFLKKNKMAYKNIDTHRATLSETLKRLIGQDKIEKIPRDNTSPYPRYTAIGKSKFNVAFDGYAFKSELLHNFFGGLSRVELENDVESMLGKKMSQNEKRILNLVILFGIHILFTLLASYKRPIQERLSNKENFDNREIWLLNSLDLETFPNSNRPSRHFSVLLLQKFLESHKEYVSEHNNLKGIEDDLIDPVIQKQVKYASSLMKQLFPTTMKWLVEESKGDLLSQDLRNKFRKEPKAFSRIREFIP